MNCSWICESTNFLPITAYVYKTGFGCVMWMNNLAHDVAILMGFVVWWAFTDGDLCVLWVILVFPVSFYELSCSIAVLWDWIAQPLVNEQKAWSFGVREYGRRRQLSSKWKSGNSGKQWLEIGFCGALLVLFKIPPLQFAWIFHSINKSARISGCMNDFVEFYPQPHFHTL